MKKNICVVMSTYNGEKYIEVQLDSLLKQNDVNLTIFIRDDGSTDHTSEILNHYSQKYNNIIVSLEKNIGFKKSFLKALKDAPESDYYGFCDQDDYWFPNKLSSTLNLLYDEYNLAFGNAIVTDENLTGNSMLYSRKDIPGFPECITSSNTHGFLFCFDKSIRDLAIRIPLDEFSIPHDFWLITIANIFGMINFDINLVLARYRRLPNSVSKRHPLKLFISRLKALLFSKGIVDFYSNIILKLYNNELTIEKKELVYACATYKREWSSKKYLLKCKSIKAKYKVKVLLNRL